MIKKLQITLLSLLMTFSLTLSINAKTDDIIPMDQLELGGEVYLLMDRDSKAILAEEKSNEQVAPASLTKALTAITVIETMEPFDLNQDIKVDPQVFIGIDLEASIVGFHAGEVVSLEDILQGIMLPSGADATRAISYHLYRDTEALAEAMNEKAQDIGMHDSNFVNTTGLDQENHYSTAHDLALLIDYALENEVFRDLYKSVEYTTSKNDYHFEGIELQDRNLMYAQTFEDNYIIGAKSGYTDDAQRALSSLAQHEGKELILITVKNPNIFNRFGPIDDAQKIYKRAFNDYKEITAINKNTVFDTLEIKHALDYEYALEKDLRVYIPKDLNTNDLKIQIKDKPMELIAPVEPGETMGILEVSYNDKIIYRETLQTDTVVPIKLSTVIFNFAVSFATIVAMALGLVGLFVLFYRSIAKRRRRNY